MDTYSRALIGSRSRASGEYFEGMISAACQFYEEKGISVIEKTPEPMRVPLKQKYREKEDNLSAALRSRHSRTSKGY